MSLTNPIVGGAAVTPSDSADLPGGVTSCLWVGGQGDLAVITAGGSNLIFADAVGWMPIQATRVKVSGTTATLILALYGSPA